MKIEVSIKDGYIVPTKPEQLKDIKNGVYVAEVKNMDTRTIRQNSAIHLWCEMIATTLNNENMVIQEVIKINTKWNMIKVKEMLFKPVVKKLYTKDSTTKLNTNEFELIIDTLCRYMAHKGITLPEFPNRDRLNEITKQ